MAMLSFLFPESRSLENPSTPIDEYEWNGLPYELASAGVKMSRDVAYQFHAIYRAVNLISSLSAKLPLEIKRVLEGGKELDARHPAFNLLRHRPGPYMNAFTLRKTAESHRNIVGNAYILVRRLGSGQPYELELLDPDNTWPVRVNGKLVYTTRVNTAMFVIDAPDVIHLKGLGFNGLVGYPVTHLARDSFGGAIAGTEYANRFFRNNAVPSAVLEVPGAMPPDAQSQFIQLWKQIHGGTDRQHGIGIITNGGKLSQLSINAKDAQLLEQRKFSIIEIANWFDLPPHKLGDDSRTAYNSIEAENQSVLDDCLDWRLVDWEQECWDKLLTEQQKKSGSHTVEADRKQLLRANLQARAEYYAKALAGAPWMTIDQVRVEEGYNELEGELGDEIIFPANFQTQQEAPATAETQGEPGPETEPDEPAKTDETRTHVIETQKLFPLVSRTCTHLADRIGNHAKRKAKEPRVFSDWVNVMREQNADTLLEEFTICVDACEAAGCVCPSPADLTSRMLDEAHESLNDLVESKMPYHALPAAVNEWAERFCGPFVQQLAGQILQGAN